MEIIKIDEQTVRVIYGALYSELKIDWSIKELSALKRLINFAFQFEDQLPSLKKAKYENLHIHEDGNHLDVVDNGKSTLNLLTIEDHWVKK